MKRANTMSTITVELTIWVKTKFIPSNAQKINGFISPHMSNFHSLALGDMRPWDSRSMCLSLLDLQLDVPDHLLVLELGTLLIVHQEPLHPVLGCFLNLGEPFAHMGFAERHLLVLEILLVHVIDRFGLGRSSRIASAGVSWSSRP